MLKSIKVYAVFIISALLVGGLSGLLTAGDMAAYSAMAKPPFTPPPIVFMIVWPILYTLMGAGAARVYLADSPDTKPALRIYALQLLINFLWSPIFFGLEWYLVAFIWLLALWFAVIIMTRRFGEVDRLAGILQIPYIIWLTFAAYLSFATWIMYR